MPLLLPPPPPPPPPPPEPPPLLSAFSISVAARVNSSSSSLLPASSRLPLVALQSVGICSAVPSSSQSLHAIGLKPYQAKDDVVGQVHHAARLVGRVGGSVRAAGAIHDQPGAGRPVKVPAGEQGRPRGHDVIPPPRLGHGRVEGLAGGRPAGGCRVGEHELPDRVRLRVAKADELKRQQRVPEGMVGDALLALDVEGRMALAVLLAAHAIGDIVLGRAAALADDPADLAAVLLLELEREHVRTSEL